MCLNVVLKILIIQGINKFGILIENALSKQILYMERNHKSTNILVRWHSWHLMLLCLNLEEDFKIVSLYVKF